MEIQEKIQEIQEMQNRMYYFDLWGRILEFKSTSLSDSTVLEEYETTVLSRRKDNFFTLPLGNQFRVIEWIEHRVQPHIITIEELEESEESEESERSLWVSKDELCYYFSRETGKSVDALVFEQAMKLFGHFPILTYFNQNPPTCDGYLVSLNFKPYEPRKHIKFSDLKDKMSELKKKALKDLTREKLKLPETQTDREKKQQDNNDSWRHVYVFSMNNGTIKIGVSNNILKRAREIRGGSGLEILKICYTVKKYEKATAIEAIMHKLFWSEHTLGEYFTTDFHAASDALLEFGEVRILKPSF